MELNGQEWQHFNESADVSCLDGTYGPLRVFLTSTKDSVDIVLRPECAGASFQEKLSNALVKSLRGLRVFAPEVLSSLGSLSVLYLLRGGLNFNLHEVAFDVFDIDSEVSFLSSQRIESAPGAFAIGESGYAKWNLPPASLLLIGDICATGTTIRHALNRVERECGRLGRSPRRLIIMTLGTTRARETLVECVASLTRSWAGTFEGAAVVFLEGIFTLYEAGALLEPTHIPNTDFLRKGASLSVELELASLRSPAAFLERCIIYDGGSRAFEPTMYRERLRGHWIRLLSLWGEESPLGILAETTDLLAYELSFRSWRKLHPEWAARPEDLLKEVHQVGREVLSRFRETKLSYWCERRIQELTAVEQELDASEGGRCEDN